MSRTKQQKHFDRVAQVSCVVCCSGPSTIHHVHGTSIQERLTAMGYEPTRSSSQRGYGDALVLPLCPTHHTGKLGIDGGMGEKSWEAQYGTQASLIDEVSTLVGYDLWKLWVEWRPSGPPKIVGRR